MPIRSDQSFFILVWKQDLRNPWLEWEEGVGGNWPGWSDFDAENADWYWNPASQWALNPLIRWKFLDSAEYRRTEHLSSLRRIAKLAIIDRDLTDTRGYCRSPWLYVWEVSKDGIAIVLLVKMYFSAKYLLELGEIIFLDFCNLLVCWMTGAVKDARAEYILRWSALCGFRLEQFLPGNQYLRWLKVLFLRAQ